MEIINNEFDIKEPNPLENLEAFLTIGNAQDFLDKHFKEVTKPLTLKIGSMILKGLRSSDFYQPICYMFGYNIY